MGEGILSRLFKKEKKIPTAEASPSSQIQPIQKTAPAGGAEYRKQILKERGLKQAQGGYKNLVEDAKAGITHHPSGTSSAEIKEGSEKIAMTQLTEDATRVQNKFAPEGKAGARFSKIIRTEKPMSPMDQKPAEKEIPPVQTSVQTPSQENTKPTLSERRIKEPA